MRKNLPCSAWGYERVCQAYVYLPFPYLTVLNAFEYENTIIVNPTIMRIELEKFCVYLQPRNSENSAFIERRAPLWTSTRPALRCSTMQYATAKLAITGSPFRGQAKRSFVLKVKKIFNL